MNWFTSDFNKLSLNCEVLCSKCNNTREEIIRRGIIGRSTDSGRVIQGPLSGMIKPTGEVIESGALLSSSPLRSVVLPLPSYVIFRWKQAMLFCPSVNHGKPTWLGIALQWSVMARQLSPTPLHTEYHRLQYVAFVWGTSCRPASTAHQK